MALKTLSRQQFKQQRPQGDYENYLRYLAKRRPPVIPQTGGPFHRSPMQGTPPAGPPRGTPPAVVARPRPRPFDPYAPLAPGAIERMVGQEVNEPYNRMVDALTIALTGKAALASDKERARGSALAQALAPYAGRISSTFNTAAGAVGADASRIAGGLAQGGQQLAGELGGKLSGMQAPGAAHAEFAGGAQRTGEGAAGAINALGSAEMQRLRGEGAAHSEFAGKLPGIEQLKTLKELGLIKEGLSEQLIETIGDLQVKSADEYGDALRYYRDREFQKGEARYERRTSAQAAATKRKQEQLDRQWEAATLKQAYGMPLTPREKALVNRYGSAPDAVEAAGKNRSEAADDRRDTNNRLTIERAKAAHRKSVDAANNAAKSARDAANNAAKATREAKAQAARTGLERDKAKYRAALERQKAADRKALQKQKDAAATARKKVAPGAAAGSGTGKGTSADSILGG